jgi:hypothetical protein
MGLQGVGYYKRKSVRSSEWVPCARGDCTDDYPAWVADSPYYVPGADDYGFDVAMALSSHMGPRSIPRYSLDIKDAWRVVEKLRADGWLFCIGEDDMGWWAIFSKDDERYWPNGRASEPEHAICQAALKAVGYKDG